MTSAASPEVKEESNGTETESGSSSPATTTTGGPDLGQLGQLNLSDVAALCPECLNAEGPCPCVAGEPDVRINPVFVLPTLPPPGTRDAAAQRRIAKCRDSPAQYGFCLNQVK